MKEGKRRSPTHFKIVNIIESTLYQQALPDTYGAGYNISIPLKKKSV